MARKHKVNKTQTVLDHLKTHPKAMSGKIAAALTKQGIKRTPTQFDLPTGELVMNARRWLLVVLVVETLMPGLSIADERKSAAEALKKGEQLLSAGDFDGAIAAYTEASRLDPKDHQAYQNRGVAYEKKGKKAKAEEGFAQAKKLEDKPK